MLRKEQKKYSGFSFLEMIIAIFIFSIIITTAIFVFSNVVFIRKKTRDVQKDLEIVRTALDLMAKNIRMSNGLRVAGGGSEIYMFNTSQQICVGYKFDVATKELKISQVSPNMSVQNDKKCFPANVNYNGSYVAITGRDITGKFIVVESDITPGSEKIGKATVKVIINGKYVAQTSVSFRDYEGIIQ